MPQGWRFERVWHRWLVVVPLIAVLLAAHSVGVVFVAYRQAQLAAQLNERGVLTAATVVKSRYQGSGDLGGWTIDTVTFRDEAGQTVVTSVSTRPPVELERISGALDVIYDPTHPTHIMTPAALAEFDGVNIDLVVDVAVSTLLVVLVIVSVAALAPVLRIYQVSAR